MAYSFANQTSDMISDAHIINRSVLTKNGFLLYATLFAAPSDKGMQFNYYVTNTVPAGQARSINAGVAFNNTTGTMATLTLTHFTNPTALDQDIIDPVLAGNQLQLASLKQMAGLGTTIEKCIYYGTSTGFGGLSAYTGHSLHNFLNTNTGQRTALVSTASATGLTSIFAVRFAPLPNFDGAQIPTLPYGSNLIAMNDDYGTMVRIPDDSGYLYPGYIVDPNMRGALLLPGTTCVAGIVGLTSAYATNSGSALALAVDNMLASVYADEFTYIFCNRAAKVMLSQVGKVQSLVTNVGDMNYNRLFELWDGTKLVVDDNISSALTGVVYNLS